MTSQHQQYRELSREEQVLQRIDKARSRKAKLKEERITLSHGSGGKATQTLIEAVFLEAFANPLLAPLEDLLLAAQLLVLLLVLRGHVLVASFTRSRVKRPKL